MEHMTHESDQRTSSEDVEHLCESTIELIKTLNQQLAAVKLRATAAGAVSTTTPAAGTRNVSKPTAVDSQEEQPVLCNTSNASNRYAATGDNIVVLTSPSEIPLTLRLDSWLGSDGRLVVKPSIIRDEHQGEKEEEDEDQRQRLEFGTTGSNSSRPLSHIREPQQQTRACTGCCYCEAAGACANDDDCETCDNGCVLQAQQKPQPQQPKPRLQRQNRIFLATTGVNNSSNGAAPVGGGSGRSLQPRRSLRLVPATSARSSAVGGSAEKETQTIIRKLHRLLSLELKRSASRTRGVE